MYHDPEILAMSQVFEAFKDLDNDQIKRIIDWLTSKFGIKEFVYPEVVVQAPILAPEPAPVPAPAPAEVIDVEKTIEKEETTAAQEIVAPEPLVAVEEDTAPQEPAEEPAPEPDPAPETTSAGTTKNLGIKRYKTIENLFLAANVDTVPQKILLAGAFLQEKLNYEEFGSYEINSRLKKISYGIKNVTNAINSLMRKKPALIIQTRKDGPSKQAKRRFRVTQEGLKIALDCLRK